MERAGIDTPWGIDVPSVLSEESVDLCLHHLSLADAYFSGVDDSHHELLLKRMVAKLGEPAGRKRKLEAAQAFLAVLIAEQAEWPQ